MPLSFKGTYVSLTSAIYRGQAMILTYRGALISIQMINI